jgi:hypothetical protein
MTENGEVLDFPASESYLNPSKMILVQEKFLSI